MSRLHLTYDQVRKELPIWQRKIFLDCINYEISEGKVTPTSWEEAPTDDLAQLGFTVVRPEE